MVIEFLSGTLVGMVLVLLLQWNPGEDDQDKSNQVATWLNETSIKEKGVK